MQESPTPTKLIVPFSHSLSESRRPKLAAERHQVFSLVSFTQDFNTVCDIVTESNITIKRAPGDFDMMNMFNSFVVVLFIFFYP